MRTEHAAQVARGLALGAPDWSGVARAHGTTVRWRGRPARSRNRALSEILAEYILDAPDINEIVVRMSDVLEMHLLWAVTLEEATRLGAKTFQELRTLRSQVTRVALHRVGANGGWKRPLILLTKPLRLVPAPDKELPDLAGVASQMEWRLDNPELPKLLMSWDKEISPAVRARIERARAASRAFVTRQRSASTHHQRIGKLFEDGKISIADVAVLIGATIPDAIVFLETNGWTRSSRTEFDRALEDKVIRQLEALRAAGDRWWESPELIRRDAIATQRIECIDAREHL